MGEDVLGPVTDHTRWSPLLVFIEKWRTPLSSGDGVSAQELDAAEKRLGLPLPTSLREWYLMVGGRDDLVRLQNKLVPPDRLYIDDETLIFLLENQDTVAWGVRLKDLHQTDPAVILAQNYTMSNYDWIEESASLSSFVYQMIVLETALWGEHRGWFEADNEGVAMMRHHFKTLGFPDWHWPKYPTQVFGDEETLLTVAPLGEGSEVYIKGLTEESFRHAVNLLGIRLGT